MGTTMAEVCDPNYPTLYSSRKKRREIAGPAQLEIPIAPHLITLWGTFSLIYDTMVLHGPL
jgi:hypothetical protein